MLTTNTTNTVFLTTSTCSLSEQSQNVLDRVDLTTCDYHITETAL